MKTKNSEKKKGHSVVLEYLKLIVCEECLRDGLDIDVSSIEGFKRIELGK